MLRSLLSILLFTLLAACAAPAPVPGEVDVRYGRVTQIEAITIEGDPQLGLGAIAGAVVGGVIGNQIGGGVGKDIATIGGVVAGGYVGNKIQNNSDRRPGQRIIVQLDNGGSVGITQPEDASLRVGERVRIDGSGNKARVLRM